MKKNRPFQPYFLQVILALLCIGGFIVNSQAQEWAGQQFATMERNELTSIKGKPDLDGSGKPFLGAKYFASPSPEISLDDRRTFQDKGQKSGVTLVVTNTNDSGEGSLRWAIQQANLTTDLDIIEFNIPGSGPHYIQPTNRLGYINNPVIIDGTTQPGWAVGAPVIVLDGSLTPDGQEGFRFYDNAHGSEIRGLVIGGFDRPIPDGQPQAGYNGFAIVIEVNNAKVQGNFLGIAPDGVTPFPNVRGVQIMNSSNNLVGGITPEERNVISSHTAIGVAIFGNEVRPGPNSLDNVISGNYIGTDVSGTVDRGNSTNIQIAESASNTLVGGASVSQRNIISGAYWAGVLIASPGTLNTQVKGNFIGTDVTGTVSIPNYFTGVSIYFGASQSLVGGSEPGARNIISGNGQAGIELGAGYGFEEIEPVNTNNVIAGNYIGLDVNASPLTNGAGVLIYGVSQYNTVGGTTAAERNIISGNNSDGILLSGDLTKFNQILGNYIGTNPEGTAGYALTNGYGIYVGYGTNNNTIGGLNPGEGNLISGNYAYGVVVTGSTSTQNKILGNLIGTNASGTGAVGNRAGGIGIIGSPSTQIQGNVISGNGNSGSTAGIEVIGNTARATIRGNKIGVGITGQVAIPNIGNGIILRAPSNTIGGIIAGDFNIISGNTSNGILLLSLNGSADQNNIWGNYIGTNPEGLPLGNGANGIDIGGGVRNNIGGSDPSLQNKIAHNAGRGVSMSEFLNLVPIRNAIRGNSIFSNSGHGILLGNYISIPGNDPGDADTGPNQLQNFPEISSATFGGGQLEVSYFVSSDPLNAHYPIRVEFFSTNPNERQGKTFIGFDSFETTDFSAGTKTVTLPIPAESGFIAGHQITATATDGFGNTSHFGALVTTQAGQMVYTITSSAGTGGTIDPLGETFVAQGADQQFTITPEVGYEILDVLVDDVSVGAVGEYLFENVTSDHSIEATFQLLTNDLFNLTLEVNPVGAGTVTGGGSFEENQLVQITASANSGYDFVNWTWEGMEVSADSEFTFNMPPEDLVVIANFEHQGFTIAASAGTGGTISPSGVVAVEYGASQLFSISASSGYEISDVLVNGQSVGAVSSYLFENVTSDQSIHATFELLPPDLYSLSLQVNPVGAGTVSGGGSFEEAQQVQVSASPNAGFDFVNWTKGGVEISTAAEFTYEMPAEDVVLVANFIKQTFIIAASAGTGGTISPSGDVVVEYGASQLFSISAGSGYEISDVLVNGQSVGAVSSFLFENVTSDQSIHATFDLLPPDLYSLSLQVNPVGAGTVSGGGSFEEAQQVQVSVSPNAGFDFVNWTKGGVEISTAAEFTYEMPAEDVVLVANFIKQTFIIAASAGTGGTISPSGDVAVEYGASQLFSISAGSGYEISDVLVNGQSVGAVSSYLFEEVTANQSIHASFELLPPDLYSLNLQVNPEGAGTVSGGGSFEEGQQVQVSASPNAGFDFVNWTRDGAVVSTAADFIFTMPAEDVVLVANFIKQTFIIAASAGTGGTISPSGDVAVENGASQLFSISAGSGYEISDVLVNGQSVGAVSSYLFEEVTANQSIHASFELLPPDLYSLSLQVNPADAGTVSGGSSYEEGQQVQISATPAAGFDFVNWTRDGAVVSTAADFIFTMPAEDVVLVANFINQTFIIAASAGTGGTISPSGDVVLEYGASQLFNISAGSGYEISDVLVNGQSVGAVSSYLFENVTSDQSIHASFQMMQPDLYALSLLASPMEGGSVYGAGDYAAGDLVNVSAMAYADYQFLHWRLDGQIISSQSSFVFTMPAEDVSLVAQFTEGISVLCSFSQGYWFANPNVEWPYDVIVGGLSFTQMEGRQFWPSNTNTQRAFTQYATIYLSGVSLGEFPELAAAMEIIDDYFANVYPSPANGQVNRAAGYIGRWIDQNHCVETLQGVAEADFSGDTQKELLLDGSIASRAFPNPFRNQLTLEFQIAEDTEVMLELYDITGNRISILFNGPAEAFESYAVTFYGRELPAGFYFYRLTTGKETFSGRLIKVK